jgi:hypothetical protein
VSKAGEAKGESKAGERKAGESKARESNHGKGTGRTALTAGQHGESNLGCYNMLFTMFTPWLFYYVIICFLLCLRLGSARFAFSEIYLYT